MNAPRIARALALPAAVLALIAVAGCGSSPPTPAQRFVSDVRSGPARGSSIVTGAESNGGVLQLGVAACQDILAFNDPARYYPALPPGRKAERGERNALIRQGMMVGTSRSQAAALVNTAIRDLCPSLRIR